MQIKADANRSAKPVCVSAGGQVVVIVRLSQRYTLSRPVSSDPRTLRVLSVRVVRPQLIRVVARAVRPSVAALSAGESYGSSDYAEGGPPPAVSFLWTVRIEPD